MSMSAADRTPRINSGTMPENSSAGLSFSSAIMICIGDDGTAAGAPPSPPARARGVSAAFPPPPPGTPARHGSFVGAVYDTRGAVGGAAAGAGDMAEPRAPPTLHGDRVKPVCRAQGRGRAARPNPGLSVADAPPTAGRC